MMHTQVYSWSRSRIGCESERVILDWMVQKIYLTSQSALDLYVAEIFSLCMIQPYFLWGRMINARYTGERNRFYRKCVFASSACHPAALITARNASVCRRYFVIIDPFSISDVRLRNNMNFKQMIQCFRVLTDERWCQHAYCWHPFQRALHFLLLSRMSHADYLTQPNYSVSNVCEQKYSQRYNAAVCGS